jgi:protein-S-isoprenylcysteine O-methyltransferase Ste14
MDDNTPETQSFTGGNPLSGSPIQDKANQPARPKGPNASAIAVGVVAILLAGLIITSETMTMRVDWLSLGPGAIVVIGVVLLLVGAIGLVRRSDDA